MNILKGVKSSNTKDYKKDNNDIFLFGKDETLLPKFTKIFGINYSVNVYYLKINSPKLNIENNSINIHLPIEYRNKNNQNLLNKVLYKMYTKIAENKIENIMEKARHLFGFAPEDYEIRKIPGKLASCNTELQLIFVNPYITMYSEEIVEYIIFHEFCHLKYKTHSKKFFELLKKYKPNYIKIEKQIQNLKY